MGSTKLYHAVFIWQQMLDSSKLKSFAEDKFKATNITVFCFKKCTKQCDKTRKCE